MSIQRWDTWPHGSMGEFANGKYVLFTDHEAAVAEAYRKGVEDALRNHPDALRALVKEDGA